MAEPRRKRHRVSLRACQTDSRRSKGQVRARARCRPIARLAWSNAARDDAGWIRKRAPGTLARDCAERRELLSFDRVTVGKVGLARSPMGLFFGNPTPSPAGMRIPTRLQRATKARSGPATPRERRSRSRQFPRWKSAVPVAPPPGCPATGSTGSLLQSCSKPRKMINQVSGGEPARCAVRLTC